ncbi:hypothetical protein [Paenarthrobacter sp. NPDC090522]|uniref:hypothetical protein n=1 Tax=Paenarthrobacter sp. NPDC090522 TaxID=3364383 RepID=UPI0037FFA3B5
MVEYFPIESMVTNLRVIHPGEMIEARQGELVYCRERIDLIDMERGIVWVRGRSGHLEPLSTQHFTFWRYVL